MRTLSSGLGALLGGGLVLLLLVITGVTNVAAQPGLPVSTGLQLWLRSDVGITVDGSGFVHTWADQSGKGNDFTRDSANAGPALIAGAGPGGADVLRFDGVDDVLRSQALLVAGKSVTVFTVIAVLEPGYAWQIGTPYDEPPRRLFYDGYIYGGTVSPDYFDVAHDYGNNARANYPGINDTEYKALTITGSELMSNVRVFVNGEPATMTFPGGDYSLTFWPGNTLGSVHATPKPFTAVNAIEFIVYDRELSQTERQAVEAYLMLRYFTRIPLAPSRVWIGLKNSDDQGTPFDLGVEFYKNDSLIAAGFTPCITGVTRNPALAKEVSIAFGDVADETLSAGDQLRLRVLARIGTLPDGTRCPGHASATGLRLYYNASSWSSRVGIVVPPDDVKDYFLRSDGATCYLDAVAPTSSTAAIKDSGPLKYAGGNRWSVIGSCGVTVQ